MLGFLGVLAYLLINRNRNKLSESKIKDDTRTQKEDKPSNFCSPESSNKPNILVLPSIKPEAVENDVLYTLDLANEIRNRLTCFRTINVIPTNNITRKHIKQQVTPDILGGHKVTHVAKVNLHNVNNIIYIKVSLEDCQTNEVLLKDQFQTHLYELSKEWNRIVKLIAGRLAPTIDKNDLK